MMNVLRLPRRNFLRQATLAGCGLALHGLRSPTAAASSAGYTSAETAPGATGLLTHPRGDAKACPIFVVTLPVAADVNPRARAWSYLTEILRRAGLFFEPLAPAQLEELFHRPPCVVILAGHLPLTGRQREALTTWVKSAVIYNGSIRGRDRV